MEKKNFRKMLENLHQELENMESVDEKGREYLRILMKDIQQILEKSDEGRSLHPNSLIERLKQTIQYFEESHPTLALTMRKVSETLSNMGI